tara:strand:- start:240 stop:452 length:213 start_codon:yes stop_codon:yes gene_type:complete
MEVSVMVNMKMEEAGIELHLTDMRDDENEVYGYRIDLICGNSRKVLKTLKRDDLQDVLRRMSLIVEAFSD